MQERPIAPLAQALLALGGSVEFLKNEGYPPLKVSGHLQGGRVIVDGTISSQFISSILLAAPYAETGSRAHHPVTSLFQSYLDITLDVMQAFGAACDPGRVYTVSGEHTVNPTPERLMRSKGIIPLPRIFLPLPRSAAAG